MDGEPPALVKDDIEPPVTIRFVSVFAVALSAPHPAVTLWPTSVPASTVRGLLPPLSLQPAPRSPGRSPISTAR
jgi:hypothetical protein